MHSLLGAEWSEVINRAKASLESKDEDLLGLVDSALHGRFYEALRGGEAARAEFAAQMLRIVDARVARPLGRAIDPGVRAVTVWRHLMALMQGVQRGVNPLELARIFLDTREHAKRLLQLVQQSGQGIGFQELVDQLPMQKSNVSRLAGEMEELGLIERLRVGRNAVYMMGLQGSLLSEEFLAADPPVQAPEGLRPLRNPKLALCA